MVDFLPFRGIRYTPDAGSLPELICPPYDVISDTDERALLSRSANNFVRVELSEPAGSMPAERYAGAAATLNAWLADDVLAVDEAPSYYLLRQRFSLGAAALERYALYGALRLEPLGEGVLPHEDTAQGPKEDRLALMEATAANLSPLMMLYRDDSRSIATVRNRTMAHAPAADFTADDGQHYTLWRIDGEEDIGRLASILANERAYVADGHHRYETALVYAEAHPDETAAQHVMTCLIDFDDPGLRILPYNRVLGGLTDSLYEAVARWVREVFIVQALDAPASYGDRLEAMAAEAGAGGPAIVMAGPGDAAYLLTLQDPESLLRMVPSGINVPLHHVEAWVLQEVVLRPLLGPRMERYLTYTHDSAAALAVANGEAQYAFLSKGVPTDLFERIVGDGVRMPRKSTYFWPKLPSGLVARRLMGAV